MIIKSCKHYLDWSTEGKPKLWRYLLVLILGIGIMPISGLFLSLFFGESLKDASVRTFFVLYAFLPALVLLPLLVKWLLGRPGYSVWLPAWPGRWRDYGIALLLGWLVMTVIFIVKAQFIPLTYRGFDGIDAMSVLLILPLLLGYVIQTSWEEFYFRGILMQFTQRLTRFVPIIILVQAVVFGLMHIGNLEAFGGGILASMPYFITALTLGWLAWRTGSLLISMGLHLANNSFLTVFVGIEGDVIHSIGPFLDVSPTLLSSSLFSLSQAILQIIAVEILLRKGVIGNRA